MNKDTANVIVKSKMRKKRSKTMATNIQSVLYCCSCFLSSLCFNKLFKTWKDGKYHNKQWQFALYTTFCRSSCTLIAGEATGRRITYSAPLTGETENIITKSNNLLCTPSFCWSSGALIVSEDAGGRNQQVSVQLNLSLCHLVNSVQRSWVRCVKSARVQEASQ